MKQRIANQPINRLNVKQQILAFSNFNKLSAISTFKFLVIAKFLENFQ